ncbi:MAG: hypothetical protein Q8Q50_02280, partial [Methylobacter sp.]|nr:hypothetical protein [Methylobacter sp.]
AKKRGICVKKDEFWLGLGKNELHMRKNCIFEKNATPDDLRIAWIRNIFTVSRAWERDTGRSSASMLWAVCWLLASVTYHHRINLQFIRRTAISHTGH